MLTRRLASSLLSSGGFRSRLAYCLEESMGPQPSGRARKPFLSVLCVVVGITVVATLAEVAGLLGASPVEHKDAGSPQEYHVTVSPSTQDFSNPEWVNIE